MPGKKKKAEIVARYDYKNQNGATIYQVCERNDGSKVVRSPKAGNPSEWSYGRAKYGIPAVPYRLPDVLAAAKRSVETIWIVPTERDADDLYKRGIAATCAIWDGEPRDNDWKREWTPWLQGFRRAIIIARNDPPPEKRTAESVLAAYIGQRRAEHVRQSIEDEIYGAAVRCLTLPPINGKRPAGPAQWFDAGGTLDALKEAVRSAPPWRCPDAMDECTAEELERMASETLKNHGPERPAKLGPAALSDAPDGASVGSPASASAAPASAEENASRQVRGAPEASASDGGGEGEDEEDPDSFLFLRRALIRILANSEVSAGEKRRLECETVTAWMNHRGRFFYDKFERTHAAAKWFDQRAKRLHLVNDDYFKSWLARATAFNREHKDFKFFMSAIQDESLVGARTSGVEPRRYWTREDDAIYLSCGEGRSVRITADRVEEVDNGEDGIVFESNYTLDPWTLKPENEARDPFEACSVFSGMATADSRGKMLTKLWLCSMFGCSGWKPLLVLTGTVGSGKTRVATAFFELIGIPARVTGIDTMGNIKDFWTSIDKGGLFVLDNADHHIEWLKDALSTISTGATFEKKKLYTDTTTITQKARCWAVVTSANPTFAADAGLADRLITVQLQRTERDTAESALEKELADARDAGLSWIAHIMRRALADTGNVPKGLNRRHPDWAAWAFKLGRAMGKEEEARAAISENEAFKSLFALSNDSFCKWLLIGVGDGFEGSVDELRDRLAQKCEGFSPDLWTAPKIGKAIKNMEAHLVNVFKMVKKTPQNKAHYTFFSRKDGESVPPTPEQGLLETPNLVGGVRGSDIKVAGNSLLRDFSSTTPNHPNLVRGEEIETEDSSIAVGPGEEAGWDSL